MPYRSAPIRWLISFALAALTLGASNGQERQTSPRQSDDVVRVETALVQTDVMVFDKYGKFVDGLKP